MGIKPWAFNETDWLERAREARDQADNLVHPEARRVMMEIAAVYQRLAQYSEERTAGRGTHKNS
jgi:hypothetical protein